MHQQPLSEILVMSSCKFSCHVTYNGRETFRPSSCHFCWPEGYTVEKQDFFYVMFYARGLYDFYVAELHQVYETSILGMNTNCL